jgi:hypothetical protein
MKQVLNELNNESAKWPFLPVVNQMLQNLEDKILERGLFTKYVGTGDFLLTIQAEDQEYGIVVAVRVNSDAEDAKLAQEDAEQMADYVNERLSELLSEEFDSDTSSQVISEIYGVCVFMNGERRD